jgi:integrase
MLAGELAPCKLAQEPKRKKPDSLVVVTPAGDVLTASNFLSRGFYPALAAAGLPRAAFHTVRHTVATALASNGTAPGVVHRLLGHTGYATTLKLYGGITDEARADAADAIGAAVGGLPDKHTTNG